MSKEEQSKMSKEEELKMLKEEELNNSKEEEAKKSKDEEAKRMLFEGLKKAAENLKNVEPPSLVGLSDSGDSLDFEEKAKGESLFGSFNPLLEYPGIDKMMKSKVPNTFREVALLVYAKAFDFIPKDGTLALKGISFTVVICSPSKDSYEEKGHSVEQYSLKLSRPKEVLSSFEALPFWGILEFSTLNKKVRLVNVYPLCKLSVGPL